MKCRVEASHHIKELSAFPECMSLSSLGWSGHGPANGNISDGRVVLQINNGNKLCSVIDGESQRFTGVLDETYVPGPVTMRVTNARVSLRST